MLHWISSIKNCFVTSIVITIKIIDIIQLLVNCQALQTKIKLLGFLLRSSRRTLIFSQASPTKVKTIPDSSKKCYVFTNFGSQILHLKTPWKYSNLEEPECSPKWERMLYCFFKKDNLNNFCKCTFLQTPFTQTDVFILHFETRLSLSAPTPPPPPPSLRSALAHCCAIVLCYLGCEI